VNPVCLPIPGGCPSAGTFYGFDGGVQWNGLTCNATIATPVNGIATTTCHFHTKAVNTSQLFHAFSNTAFIGGTTFGQNGIAFSSWGGACSGTSADCTLSSITTDITVVANFVETTS
jgi:hypothetical protein